MCLSEAHKNFPMTNQKRLYQIDLFRFVAAMSVLLHHYLFRGYAEGNMSSLDFGEISQFFKYGYLGVDFFFILSGFVISLSIKGNSLSKFVFSRITRLYPIYWLSVILTFLVILFFGAPRYFVTFKQLLFNLTMFQDYFDVESIDGVYWSLVIEMRFYIMIALFLIVNKVKKNSLDTFIYVWILLSVLIVFLDKEAFFVRVLKYVFILEWSSYFIAGMVFSQIFRDRFKMKHGLLLSICLFLTFYNLSVRIEEFDAFYLVDHSTTIIFTTVTLFFVLMFFISKGKLGFLNSPKLLQLGLLTYPLYLLHQIIGFIIFNNLGDYFNKYILVVLTTIVMILVSYVISKKIDPILSSALRKNLESFYTWSKLKKK